MRPVPNRIVRGLVLAAALAGLAAVSTPRPCDACGFHGGRFRDANLPAAWRKLKLEIAERQDSMLLIAVIQDLLDILRYVDPYNFAPDSPPWMQSESGREQARAFAEAALVEIAADAAQPVWCAWLNELRFDTAERRGALEALAAARMDLQSAEAALQRQARAVFPAWVPPLPTAEELFRDELRAAWYALLYELPVPIQSDPATRMDIASGDGLVHRPMLRARLPRAPAPRDSRWIPRLAEKLSREDATYRDTELYAAFRDLRRKEDAAAHAQREYVAKYAADVRIDLFPSPAYAESLERVLLRCGARVRPMLEESREHRSYRVATASRRLLQALEGPAPFAPAALPEPEAGRLARVLLDVWDLNAPEPGSEISRRARARLRTRGMASVPDLLKLLDCPELNLEPELLAALEFVTGLRLGPDLPAWKRWHTQHLRTGTNMPSAPQEEP